jgi:arylsulfotransferase ASST
MVGTAQFAWQHDMHLLPGDVVRIFDNEAAPRVRDESRALFLRLDEARKRATVVRAETHEPNPLRSGTQGNVQGLADGGIFVGWGSQGYFTQYDGDGDVVFDARIARGQDTYRAYRAPWVGTPSARPSIAATSRGRNVYASWNGATEVARWEVLAGASESTLAPAGSAARSGFETRIRTAGGAFVAVRALDAAGNVLGTSRAISSDD